MHDLQDLGEALVQLQPTRLAALALPERLADAIGQARAIGKHEARRRQLQFIGQLMRDVDPGPIRARLAQWGEAPAAEKARLAAVERWRVRLLAEPDALDALCAAAPGADRGPPCIAGRARAGRARACRTAARVSRAFPRAERVARGGSRVMAPTRLAGAGSRR